MTAKMIFKLKSPVGQKIDNLCERFPLISSVIVQLAAAIFMVGGGDLCGTDRGDRHMAVL